MKLVDIKSSTFVKFIKENNMEGPKFEVGEYVRISKYKNIFVKVYTPNWSKKSFRD